VIAPGAPQPLWALVPAEGRAVYLRRTATAVLDELDSLADQLAREVGQPRTEALLAELLPSVGGLHDLADEGPGALSERRLGRIPALRAGRRSALLQAPLGVVGVRAGTASPWAGPVLETGAALLAGNGVMLASPVSEPIRAAFVRGGVPEELIAAVAEGDDLIGCANVLDTRPRENKGTMLVLDGAPLERTVSGALWAAFAGSGRHHGAVGRMVVVPSRVAPLAAALAEGARRLHPGDPRLADTEIGPLMSADQRDQVAELVEAAVAEGATLLCGGSLELPTTGAFYAPAVLRGVPAGARILREPVPGPVLAMVEAGDEQDAIALAHGSPAVSVWAGDRGHAERVARTLGAEVAWVNEHGHSIPGAAVLVANHVRPRRLESQPTRLRSARWLPYDPALVRAATASAQVIHGRESARLGVLRRGAVPLVRTAARLAREALER
jgi:acyl-CoA reductase-like NAD-dependent aldehyde dehydrogenase